MLDNKIMTDADTKSLYKKLQSLRNGTMNSWTCCPELAALLCLPPDENSHGRFVDIMGNIQLLSALILSATLGVALNPLDVKAMPENEQTLGDVFNFFASLLAVINVITATFGSYILMQALTVSQTDMVRILARSSSVVLYMWFTFLSMFFIVALICFSVFMKSSSRMAVPTVIVIITFVVAMLFYFYWQLQKLFPVTGGAWCRTFMVEMPWSNRDSKRIGDFMLGVAEGHLGRDVVEQQVLPSDVVTGTEGGQGEQGLASPSNTQVDAQENEGKQRCQEQVSSLRTFMEGALKHSNPSPQRMELLVAALLEEDLFLSVLSDAAYGDNGEKLVFEALDLDGDVRILRGERLALSKALWRCANNFPGQ